jgi:vitamin B12 transporter
MTNLEVSANYTYTESTDKDTGLDLPRRPRHTTSIRGDYTWANGLATGATIRYVGKAWENAANTNKIDSYVLVDATARYPLSASLELTGRVENVFNESYETAKGYGTYPRAGYIGIRLRY